MENKSGKNAQNLKAENRGLLFRYIATQQQTSRTEMANLSGLNKMTVSKITADFIAKRYVVESAVSATRNNPIMLRLSPNAPKVIGLLIRRNYVSVVLCDFNLEILSIESEELNCCSSDELLCLCKRMVDRMMRFGNILGIGIGSIGPVDIHNGIILDPPNFFGIHDVHIVEYMRDLYRIPVYLDHHYNCTTLAELYYGNGADYENYLFLGIENGIGLGIIMNHQLLSNFTGLESELGYLCVNYDDHTPRTGVPSGFLGAYVSFDQADQKQMERNISILSFALAGLCNILNPQAIIVGDTKKKLTENDLKNMENSINQRLLNQKYRHIDVRRSCGDSNFEAASCAISIIRRVFSGELMFHVDN